MRSHHDFENIYLHCGYVDFRKGINGLCILIDQHLNQNALNGSNLFVFCNRSRDKLRLLYWDKTGFALWHKALEEDRFKWPRTPSSDSMRLSDQQLDWLLDGVDITKIKPHSEKHYESVV